MHCDDELKDVDLESNGTNMNVYTMMKHMHLALKQTANKFAARSSSVQNTFGCRTYYFYACVTFLCGKLILCSLIKINLKQPQTKKSCLYSHDLEMFALGLEIRV